jgi:CBS domain-containing protein
MKQKGKVEKNQPSITFQCDSASMPVTLRARELMDTNVVMLDGSTTVFNAIKKMVDGNIWSIVVVKQGLPVGVITERDALRRCIVKGMRMDVVKIEEIMTSPLITVDPDAHIGAVMEKMVEKAIRRVYVVENGKVIGRITQTMLFEDSLNVMEALSSMRYHM